METAPPPPVQAIDDLPSSELLLLDRQLCFAVYAASHAFARAYRPHLERLGLTYPQYLVMLVLWEQDDMTVGDIGRRLFLESSTLTPLLKRLEAAGLLHRVRDAEDERQVRVRLTEAGRALHDAALAVPRAMLCASGTDIERLARLHADMVALRAGLDAQTAQQAAAAS